MNLDSVDASEVKYAFVEAHKKVLVSMFCRIATNEMTK